MLIGIRGPRLWCIIMVIVSRKLCWIYFLRLACRNQSFLLKVFFLNLFYYFIFFLYFFILCIFMFCRFHQVNLSWLFRTNDYKTSKAKILRKLRSATRFRYPRSWSLVSSVQKRHCECKGKEEACENGSESGWERVGGGEWVGRVGRVNRRMWVGKRLGEASENNITCREHDRFCHTMVGALAKHWSTYFLISISSPTCSVVWFLAIGLCHFSLVIRVDPF